MIDHNHPAVEALADAIYWALSGQYGDFGTPSKGEAHAALTAALPHLTADDLRNTPPGRELMAEAWEEGALHQARGSAETRRVLASALTNPYRKDNA